MAADILHDGDFSLPEQFLTNDDIVSGLMSLKPEPKTWTTPIEFGSHGSPSSSALSSPIESELGSTETESEDEDYTAEFTRQVAHFMLQDDDDDDEYNVPTFASENTKVSKSLDFSGSPLLTPWSPLSSNHGSPKGHFQEPSPAARPIVSPTSNLAHNVMFHSKTGQFFTLDQLRAIQLQKKQFMKHQNTNDKERRAKSNQKLEPSQGRACGWFGNGGTIQPPIKTGSGMRALFLGGPNPRNGSCGTGVFLPHGTVNLSESRNKQGYSTVLIPDRVVQVLKLHFDRMGALSRSTAGDLPHQHGASKLNTNSNSSLFS